MKLRPFLTQPGIRGFRMILKTNGLNAMEVAQDADETRWRWYPVIFLDCGVFACIIMHAQLVRA